MRKGACKLGVQGMTLCLSLAISVSAVAEQTPASNYEPQPVKSTLADLEKQLQGTSNPEQKFYLLTTVAAAALEAGKKEKADKYAIELLTQAPKLKKNWNSGNAIQVGNLVLGRIALMSGDIEKARQYLLEAGKTPGSPQLNSFGPNMLLAKELLEKGERDVVLQYFELCGKFWTLHYGKLEQWTTAVRKGAVPDFGANLVYALGTY